MSTPDRWHVDGDIIKGHQLDMYPFLFQAIGATEEQVVLAAAAPELRDLLKRAVGVIEDIMKSTGGRNFLLQDYGALNAVLLESRKFTDAQVTNAQT